MTERVTRAGWGARLATGAMNLISANPEGCTVHWVGPKMGSFDHALCAGKVLGFQRFHQLTRRWSDIAYNELVCPHGVRFEGRGYLLGSAANGSSAANAASYAICVMAGEGDPIADVVLDAVADAVADYRKHGRAGSVVKGHRDWISTTCCGDFLYQQVKAGRFAEGATTPAPRPEPSAPRPPASAIPTVLKRAPGPHYPFPLPGGFYFGVDNGSNESVSGRHGRVFATKYDRTWIAHFATQLGRRGWSVGKDKSYLTRYGNDGQFGDEYVELVKAFQRDQGLHVDGKIGPATWQVAFERAVS